MCNMPRQHFGAASLVLLLATPCFAQGPIGIGARMTMVRGDVSTDPNAGAARFIGGQLRAKLSAHTTIEVSLDRRSETSTDLTQRVRDYPLQGSVLLFPLRTSIAPYVLGGVGWYTHAVDSLTAGKVAATASTRKMGYHAGFGGEVKLGRHTGIHADYRYTFVHFGDGANSGTSGLASRFVPSYDGSMWTAGVTFYF
jgi:hypothetical protein